MAINKISGNILQDNLQRGSNLAIQGDLVFFDVLNNKVGIGTDAPSEQLDVAGNLKVGTFFVYENGNVNAGNKVINNVSDPVAALDVVNKQSLEESFGDFTLTGTVISTSSTSSNITLVPAGNTTVIIDTTSGLVIPVGNSSTRPENPLTGTLRWNTDLTRAEIFDGVEWDQIASDVSSQLIEPDGISVSYILNKITTSSAVLVITNGIVQTPNISYSVNNNVITFVEPPLTSDIIDIRFL